MCAASWLVVTCLHIWGDPYQLDELELHAQPGKWKASFVHSEAQAASLSFLDCSSFSICSFLQDLFILLFTASRDPGIVPRNAVPPEIDEEAGVTASGTRRLPRTKDVVVNGITVKVKYCDTCMLYR